VAEPASATRPRRRTIGDRHEGSSRSLAIAAVARVNAQDVTSGTRPMLVTTATNAQSHIALDSRREV
jgi:hypothetical protein